MDIFSTIKKDHDEFRKLFDKLTEKPSRGDFQKLYRDGASHMAAEERTLYPALQDTEVRALALEALEEHNVARQELQQIEQLSFKDEHWLPKFTVLCDLVRHHMGVEEKEIFAKAKKLFDQEQLDTLLKEFNAAKKEAVAEVSASK